MPFALLVIGALLLISAVRGTSDQFFALVKGDFTEPPGFIFWAVAIFIIGAVGYIHKTQPISVAFLTLLILVLLLAKGDPTKVGGGFFTQFVKGLQSTTTAQNATAGTAAYPGTINPITALGQGTPGQAAAAAGTPAGIPGVSHTDIFGNVVQGPSITDKIEGFGSTLSLGVPWLTVN